MPTDWLEGPLPMGTWSRGAKGVARWSSRVLFALSVLTPLTLALTDWQWAVDNVSLLFTIFFGFVGCAGAISTSIVLAEIQAAERRLEADITNLEDATRRNLTGFAEIFARALWLLDKAEQEVWYVNFVFGFGRPHISDSAVAKEFEPIAKLLELPTTNFADAVRHFASVLMDKVAKVREFHALVLDPRALQPQFLTPLAEPDSHLRPNAPGGIQDRNGQVMKEELGSWNAVGGAGLTRERRGLDEEAFHVAVTESLPIQVLLTRIRSDDGGEQRWGCLVFLVGTENVGRTVPRGFYSELDHIAEVYKEFCQGLIRSRAKHIPLQELRTYVEGAARAAGIGEMPPDQYRDASAR